VTVDPQRDSALLAAKLKALVRDHAGEGPVILGSIGNGAALVRDGAAWVLAAERPHRILGPALAWARQQGADECVNVLVEGTGAGVVARRAGEFRGEIHVWNIDARALTPAAPTPFPPPKELDASVRAFEPMIRAAGAEPSIEHGVLAGEVAGLEVCRVMVDGETGRPRLEVGVGFSDREAFRAMHGDAPTMEQLAEIVRRLWERRRPGAPPHALNRLARERRLRHQVMASSAAVGCVTLTTAPPPVPRANLKEPIPCVAVGETADGQPAVVVCSSGIDLDLIPFAADARLALEPDVSLIVVVPPPDRHPATLALAERLRHPASVNAFAIA
jgi:hypothetical protein